MQIPTIGLRARLAETNNWTTDYVAAPDALYTSPDTRTPATTVEPVDTGSSVVTTAPVQGYDVDAHQRLANYSSTSLEYTAQTIESQNNFISALIDTPGGSVL